MTPLEIWGWACAGVGSMLAVPQFIKLFRDRDTAGMSLVLWQLNVAVERMHQLAGTDERRPLQDRL